MRSQEPSDSRTDPILDNLSGGVLAGARSATITYLTAAARTLALQHNPALDKPLAPLLPPKQERIHTERVPALGLIVSGLYRGAFRWSPPFAFLFLA